MADECVPQFPGTDDDLLVPGADLSGRTLRGNIAGRDLRRAKCWGTTFHGVDARRTIFAGADLRRALLTSGCDFRGADLSDTKEFGTIVGLDATRFSDDTKLVGTDLAPLQTEDPRQYRRFRAIQYAGAVKRDTPSLYWVFQVLCGCGRSWPRFLAWGLAVTLFFAATYYVGSSSPSAWWLPHLITASQEQGSAGFVTCFQFSAMTLVSFNMPDVTWAAGTTGYWVAVECWIGLAFVGVFVSVLASRMAFL